MVHFWMQVWAMAVRDTHASIGKDPHELGFSAIVVALIIVLVFIQDGADHGWSGMRTRARSLLGRDAKIVVVVIALIFIYHCGREPYALWDTEHQARDQITGDL